MVGVCAGWREKAQLGDVIVAERLFRYDGGKLRAWTEGTERLEAVFHDIRTYNLDPRWRQRAEELFRTNGPAPFVCMRDPSVIAPKSFGSLRRLATQSAELESIRATGMIERQNARTGRASSPGSNIKV